MSTPTTKFAEPSLQITPFMTLALGELVKEWPTSKPQPIVQNHFVPSELTSNWFSTSLVPLMPTLSSKKRALLKILLDLSPGDTTTSAWDFTCSLPMLDHGFH